MSELEFLHLEDDLWFGQSRDLGFMIRLEAGTYHSSAKLIGDPRGSAVDLGTDQTLAAARLRCQHYHDRTPR